MEHVDFLQATLNYVESCGLGLDRVVSMSTGVYSQRPSRRLLATRAIGP